MQTLGRHADLFLPLSAQLLPDIVPCNPFSLNPLSPDLLQFHCWPLSCTKVSSSRIIQHSTRYSWSHAAYRTSYLRAKELTVNRPYLFAIEAGVLYLSIDNTIFGHGFHRRQGHPEVPSRDLRAALTGEG
jgi:hypothetical protein